MEENKVRNGKVELLKPDIWSAVTTGITHLVCEGRPFRFFAKINKEIGVERQPAVDIIDVNLNHVRAFLDHGRVKLLVPCTEEGVGSVETLPIQTQLDHLWPASQLCALNRREQNIT
jgi:hypothetical protein